MGLLCIPPEGVYASCGVQGMAGSWPLGSGISPANYNLGQDYVFRGQPKNSSQAFHDNINVHVKIHIQFTNVEYFMNVLTAERYRVTFLLSKSYFNTFGNLNI